MDRVILVVEKASPEFPTTFFFALLLMGAGLVWYWLNHDRHV